MQHLLTQLRHERDGKQPPAPEVDSLIVTLTPIGSGGPPAIVRMRRALKCLLRVYGLRASWCEGNGDNSAAARNNTKPNFSNEGEG